jgi:hypothetical protein
MAINSTDLIKTIKENIMNLAKETLKDHVNEAADDAEFFLELSKEDMVIWARQLRTGELSKEDFAWLIKSQADAFELVALKQTGLTEVRLDEFKAAALGVMRDTVCRVVGV